MPDTPKDYWSIVTSSDCKFDVPVSVITELRRKINEGDDAELFEFVDIYGSQTYVRVEDVSTMWENTEAVRCRAEIHEAQVTKIRKAARNSIRNPWEDEDEDEE